MICCAGCSALKLVNEVALPTHENVTVARVALAVENFERDFMGETGTKPKYGPSKYFPTVS